MAPGGGSDPLVLVTYPVTKDGYSVTVTATVIVGQYQQGGYLGGADHRDWGGQMVVPFWNPDKATTQMGPDPGVQQNWTFWFSGRTPETVNGFQKPYYSKVTYHHGVNSVSTNRTYWNGIWNPAAGVMFGDSIPGLAIYNEAHNEGGQSYTGIAPVLGFPTQPYTSGINSQWSNNHNDWWWPSAGSSEYRSVELWDGVKTGTRVQTFTAQVSCIDGAMEGESIELPVPALQGILGRGESVESVQMGAVTVQKFTRTQYQTRRMSRSAIDAQGGLANVRASLSESQSQVALEWPAFRAEASPVENVNLVQTADKSYVRVIMRLAE